MSTKIGLAGIAAALLFVPHSARSEWVQVFEDDKAVYYLDPVTIRKEGDLRRVWGLTDYKQPLDGVVRSLRGLNEYDCKEERSRVLVAAFFSKNMAHGQPINSQRGPSEWDYLAPGTLGTRTLKYVCAYSPMGKP
jgi:hypothetical protein